LEGLWGTRAPRSLQVEVKYLGKGGEGGTLIDKGKENSLDIDQIISALDGLKKGLQNDGADLLIDDVSNDRVVIRLVLEERACQECIVDSEVLIAVVEAALRGVVPSRAKISIIDPRVKTGK
jgi:hypothetical protein